MIGSKYFRNLVISSHNDTDAIGEAPIFVLSFGEQSEPSSHQGIILKTHLPTRRLVDRVYQLERNVLIGTATERIPKLQKNGSGGDKPSIFFL